MDLDHLPNDAKKILQEVLGYLNFSSGNSDSRFLQGVNHLFGLVGSLSPQAAEGQPRQSGVEPTWRSLAHVLARELDELRQTSDTFRRADQAQALLRLAFDELLPAYHRFHADLLFHQTEETLFQPLFLGRACEAILAEGAPWEESQRIVRQALLRLNDFVGHRPVAVLRTKQKIQPYAHERVRPIPLYIAGAGVAVGRYHDVVEKALEILASTDEDLLRQAWFDLAHLEELALDPRAHDFDHPVNRRPNYHFGTWDPHHIDNRGFYRRFVLQQVTLDALWSRVEERGEVSYEELLFEAAAVLAGTMLMGSGITGNGPEAHDSSVTLARLLPHIASYRDAFYERLLTRVSGSFAQRLKAEATALRQPFGGARQHLNQKLARRRAEQLQRVHLARLFARMGYTEAASRQARMVPVASARMRCDMDCLLTTAHLHIDRGALDEAASLLPQVEDLLHRAIECGALIDPWNILGFGAQFSLFPSPENSIPDHRADELIELLNDLFALYARLQREAAAAGNRNLPQRLSEDLEALARWWDQFASTEVSDVEGFSGARSWESAAQVAGAVRAWHEGGTAAGDIAFWRRHVEEFHSPKAYALLVEALLEKHDLVAAMALLLHWLSQAHEIRLSEGTYSFHELAIRWMEDLWDAGAAKAATPPPEDAQRWPLARKFFDHLEASAEEFWQAPRLEVMVSPSETAAERKDEEPEQEPDGLFAAAYEEVTYRDTTDDGFESDLLDTGQPATDFELTLEADRISHRLAFLITLSRLWKKTAICSAAPGAADPDREKILAGWLAQAEANRRGLAELLDAADRYPIAAPRGTHESLVEYDRRRAIKESLLERIIAAAVETADAARVMRITLSQAEPSEAEAQWETPLLAVLRAVFRGDVERIRDGWSALLVALAQQPLLYVPTTRGGNPQRIVASRNLQQVLRRLLAHLPRLGLLAETYQLLGTIQEMERNHRVGHGAITEFDRLFEIGCRAMVECLVTSSEGSTETTPDTPATSPWSDRDLTAVLEQTAELLLRRWLEHSRNIRISVLETVADNKRWKSLKQFIQRYGHDLFTQKFMNFGNLRAILQQGVGRYLRWLEEEPDLEEGESRLVQELARGLGSRDAEQWLEITLEAVVENYSEYIDYNSTTTQSDRGEMLYTLLDFLRLEASYDRVAWNLKPVVTAHEVLVRSGRIEAARMWRRAVARRSTNVADEHQRRFERLVKQYGMRLPSVADRLGERFVRPLAIDRLCALVRPAIDELRKHRPPASFRLLEREIAQFTNEPSGVGFDVPSWLEALEDEVDRVRSRRPDEEDLLDLTTNLPPVRLSVDEVRRQLNRWESL